MSWLNAALAFVFVCNLAFLTGAAFLLYRIVDAAEGSREELKKAALQTTEAADKVYLVARRTINEMGLLNEAQATRERSATRGLTDLAAEVKALTEKLQASGTGGDQAREHQFNEDERAKLRVELNATAAKNHHLQEEISQTQYRLKEAMVANREMRQELSEAQGIKKSVVDKLIQRAEELQAQLEQAQARAKEAERLAEANAVKLDDIKEQLAQKAASGGGAGGGMADAGGEAGLAGVDQSGLIQSQQDQIDMLAEREKALMSRMDQMEQAFVRTQAEKTFIEERFLQLDTAVSGPTSPAP